MVLSVHGIRTCIQQVRARSERGGDHPTTRDQALDRFATFRGRTLYRYSTWGPWSQPNLLVLTLVVILPGAFDDEGEDRGIRPPRRSDP